jgi:hypothetical protein
MASYCFGAMVESGPLSDLVAKEVEEQLFSALRQQTDRSVPIDLPRNDFWSKVGLLLDTIEVEIHQQYHSQGPDLRLQNLQKRQANIRRTANDLARRRLVALLQHAASSSFRSGGDNSLTPMDWTRHDPKERTFYSNLIEQVNLFKNDVGWQAIQQGTGPDRAGVSTHAPGTTQLDEWSEQPGGLTGSGPPPLEIIEDERLDEIIEDEEEIIAKLEAYPELEGLQPVAESTRTVSVQGSSHLATPELAPTKSRPVLDFDAWAEAESTDEPVKEKEEVIPDKEMMRIRVLQTMPDAIWLGEDEIIMQAGDIHFVEQSIANYLIESSVAAAAPL